MLILDVTGEGFLKLLSPTGGKTVVGLYWNEYLSSKKICNTLYFFPKSEVFTYPNLFTHCVFHISFVYQSFMASDSSQTHVNLTRKFDNWEYSWWNSLNKRMPWFDAKGTHHMALLTTSDSPTYYPSGSIIWGGPDRFPSDWIWAGGMRNPGVIWYWLNEDDCDEDRKPGITVDTVKTPP